MAVNRKIKSFSPYSYNVSYRKPGTSPLNQKAVYLPNAGFNVAEYVVRERTKNSFPFLTNTFYYIVDDNCNITFQKCVSDFKILPDNITVEEFTSSSIESGKTNSVSFDIKNKVNGPGYTWFSNTKLHVAHNLAATSVDVVIILNDVYYNNYTFVENDSQSIEINFNENISISDLKICVYQIDSGSADALNNMKYFIYDVNDLTYDLVNKNYMVQNERGTTRVKIKVKDLSNSVLNLKTLNVLPSYIYFNKSDIKILSDYQVQKTSLLEEKTNLSLNLNDQNLERYNEIESELTKLNEKIDLVSSSNNLQIDLSTIEMYYPMTGLSKYYLQFGKSQDNVIWDSSDNNYYSFHITHGLSGFVNFIIDNDENKNMNYIIKYVSENEIEVKFAKSNSYIPPSISLTCFKIS